MGYMTTVGLICKMARVLNVVPAYDTVQGSFLICSIKSTGMPGRMELK